MAARNSGSKVVVVAVAAIMATIGVGTIYAPYFADRDKLRGLHEEADAGLSDREKREFEAFMQQIKEQQQSFSDQKAPTMGNSMWNRMGQAAGSTGGEKKE